MAEAGDRRLNHAGDGSAQQFPDGCPTSRNGALQEKAVVCMSLVYTSAIDTVQFGVVCTVSDLTFGHA